MANDVPNLDSIDSTDLQYLADTIHLHGTYILKTLVEIRNNFRLHNKILAKLAGVTIEEIDNQVVTSPDEKTGD